MVSLDNSNSSINVTCFSAPVDERLRRLYYSPIVIKAIENIDFIGQILKKQKTDSEVSNTIFNSQFIYELFCTITIVLINE